MPTHAAFDGSMWKMRSHSTFLATLILSVQEYRQIEPSDGNWSFAQISFTGSSQMGVLTAACWINQVCNGAYCRHEKKSKRGTEPRMGSWSEQWQSVCLSHMPSLENERYSVSKAFFSVDPNVSLNYLLSRVNINDDWDLKSALETNMFEIEMLHKTFVHTETLE